MSPTQICVPLVLFGALLAQDASTRRGAPPAPLPPAPTAVAFDQLPDQVLFDQPRPAGPLWALGHTWKASVDGAGFDFIPFFGSQAPHNFPLRVRLAGATVGGEPLALPAGTPIRTGTRITTNRGSLVERLDLNLRAVEQSFVFASLPNRGAVRVDVQLGGPFEAVATPAGLRFVTAHGEVTYEKAIAIDATGMQLALPIVWNGTTAQMEIPAAFVVNARLPLVLDPLLSVNPGVGNGASATEYQRYPDLATLQSPTRNCVVWRRQWSATDQDCWGVIVDDAPIPTSAVFPIDISLESWDRPAVAGAQIQRNFLVVSQIDLGGQSWISGRIADESGTTGFEIDIERQGVVGMAGMNYRPDVGGDPIGIGAGPFTVVWEHETGPGDRDIHYKQVRSDGTLHNAMPSIVYTDPRNQTHPSISKSCRGFGALDRWTVAWQQSNGTFTDEDVYGAMIGPYGVLLQGPYAIATTAAMETLPSASSRAIVDGASYHAVAFQRDSGGQNDILCQIVRDDGTQFGQFNLSQREALGIFQSRNQIFPEVDSDGARFAIGYSEYSGTDYDTFVSTVAFEPSNNSLRIDDERVQLGSTVGVDDYWTAICAEFSGGNEWSPRYFVAGANILTNNIAVWNYGGFVPGQQYFVFNSQCGNLPIQATGVPAIGNRITFSLPTSNLSGFVFGFPGFQSLGICNCVLAVQSGVTIPNPHTWQIPYSPSLVNAFTLSVQGWAFGGSACLGSIDLSNTLDFVIR